MEHWQHHHAPHCARTPIEALPFSNLGGLCKTETQNGAPERNNLEPFSSPELLEELETWTEILKSEPEVIHRLAAFADAASSDAEGTGSSPPTAVLPGLEP